LSQAGGKMSEKGGRRRISREEGAGGRERRKTWLTWQREGGLKGGGKNAIIIIGFFLGIISEPKEKILLEGDLFCGEAGAARVMEKGFFRKEKLRP